MFTNKPKHIQDITTCTTANTGLQFILFFWSFGWISWLLSAVLVLWLNKHTQHEGLGGRLAQLVERASHVQRLCPHCRGPGLESRPGRPLPHLDTLPHLAALKHPWYVISQNTWCQNYLSSNRLLPLFCHGDLPTNMLFGNISSISSIVDLAPHMSKRGAREMSCCTCAQWKRKNQTTHNHKGGVRSGFGHTGIVWTWYDDKDRVRSWYLD